MERAVIEGHDLTKRFGQAAALAGARVAVCCGESVAVMGPSGARHQEVVLGGDIRTGVFVVLAVCYLVAIVSAGIMAVSAVLDRRRAYALLRLAGTPLAVLDRAWLQETLIPLAVMGGGSLLAGLVCAAPFALAGLLEPYGLVMLAAFACIGTLGIVAANLASRPLLRAVTTDPSPQPD